MSIDRTITISKHEVVLDRLFTLKKYELKALAWDAMYEGHQPSNVDEDTEENYEMREKMNTYLGVANE